MFNDRLGLSVSAQRRFLFHLVLDSNSIEWTERVVNVLDFEMKKIYRE